MYILGGGFNFQLLFIFTPISGEMIQIDDHIVQRGWFNHRLVCIYIYVFIYVDTKLRSPLSWLVPLRLWSVCADDEDATSIWEKHFPWRCE